MAKKIKVALVITELQIGGAEKAIVELACGLDPDRFEPVVYSLRSQAYHDGALSYIPVLRSRGIPVQFLDVAGPFGFLGGVRRLATKLRDQKADVLQSFLFHANLLSRWAARRARIPVVCSGIRVSEKERRSHLWWDHFTRKSVDSWVCVSQSVADWTEKEGKISPDRIVVIPNAVSPAPITFLENRTPTEPRSRGAAKNEPTESLPPPPPLFDGVDGHHAVFIGRLTHQKGADWLLETTPDWLGGSEDETDSVGETQNEADSAGVPANGWSLWLVGSGIEEDRLRRQVSNLPPRVREKIHFAGWRPDIPAILASADLFLLTSRWEGMPNVVLEAMMAGLPVLATRSDGVQEILGEELSASQTCSFGETSEFLAKIRPLLEEGDQRKRLGEANQIRAKADFSLTTMVSRYEDLWKRLLDDSDRR